MFIDWLNTPHPCTRLAKAFETLNSEIALAIEMGADAVDIGKAIHPPPTLVESMGMAVEVAHGSCTDLPPSKKSLASALAK